MPAIKEKAFELIEKMPDDKVVYIVNIMENLDSLFNGTEPDEEKMQTYENLKKYRRPACTSNLLKISRKGC
ncbi:MAG: hypothetical protein KH304_09505 [Clostridium sp.]|nr:hypothetical protein [Clostridium sp.]